MRVGRVLGAMLAVVLLVPGGGLGASARAAELKIATWEDVNTFDPAWLTSVERELTIMNCIYNGLVKYKEGTWEVVPDLAESWQISKDGKEITFKLRKGVQFHKGYGEMTAEDVKFSFERIIDPAAKSPEKGQWKNLDHVEVIDRYTVKLVLKERMVNLFTSTLPMNSGMIVSKKAVEEMGREKFAFNPVGTGPYELVAWKPKQRVELKAFKDYWGEKPRVEKVTFLPIVEDSTCETALKTGEVHVGRSALINLKSFEKDPRFAVYKKPALKYYWINLTVDKPPFDNLKLRQAFRYVVDVDKILQAAFFGVAQRANSMLPPGMLGYWKDAPVYKQDLEKARKLMKEGGKPDGFKVKFLVWTDDAARTLAEVVKADAAKVGIDVEIEVKEIGAFNESANKGEPNACFQFYTTTVDPGYAMGWFVSGGSWNPAHWSNPRYDKLLEKAASETDPAKRAQLYIEAQKEIDKDCWAIWVTHGVKAWVAQRNVDMGAIYPNGRLAPWTMSLR